MIIRHGPSVRSLFGSWLHSFPQRGTCVFPEWICPCLPAAAADAGWNAAFVPVLAPPGAPAPLSMDVEQLESMVHALADEGRATTVLLAHPFGYVDPGAAKALPLLQRLRIPVALDLAQAYGCHDFLAEEAAADVTFVSFNGRKLLADGGAVACATGGHGVSWQDHLGLRTRIATAVQAQRTCFASVEAQWLKLIRQRIQEQPWERATRSSLHRTAVPCAPHQAALLAAAESRGIGQPLHPNPNPGKMSERYRAWQKALFLLFPQLRTSGGSRES